jgi:GAF domain-containing protein
MRENPLGPGLMNFSPSYQKFLRALTDILLQNIGEAFYQKILDLALAFCPNAQAGSIMELKEDQNYHFVAAYGFDLKALQAISLAPDEVVLFAPQDQHSFMLHDINEFNKTYLDEKQYGEFLRVGRVQDIKETLCIPIRKGESIVAMLCLDSFISDVAFTTDEVIIAESLGALLGLAMESDFENLVKPPITSHTPLEPV